MRNRRHWSQPAFHPDDVINPTQLHLPLSPHDPRAPIPPHRRPLRPSWLRRLPLNRRPHATQT